jgi:putative endonuclease
MATPDQRRSTSSRSAGPSRPPPASADAVHFGRYGEAAAARWYRRTGHRILARNWRCREGELDLVVAKGGDVVFVEVKARTDERFGTGAEAVDHRKRRRLRVVAGRWLAQADEVYGEVRFDVVEVDRRGRLRLHQGCL